MNLFYVYGCKTCGAEFESAVLLEECVCPDCATKSPPGDKAAEQDYEFATDGESYYLTLGGAHYKLATDVSKEGPYPNPTDDLKKVGSVPDGAKRVTSGQYRTMRKDEVDLRPPTTKGHWLRFQSGKMHSLYWLSDGGTLTRVDEQATAPVEPAEAVERVVSAVVAPGGDIGSAIWSTPEGGIVEKALPWRKYVLQRHADHHDLRVGDDLTLRLSGTLLDNLPDRAEVSSESPDLVGADGQPVDARKVKGTVKLQDGAEVETLDAGQARYAKVQDAHRVEFKDGKLEGVYEFRESGVKPLPQVEHLVEVVEAEPEAGQPAEPEAEGDGHPPLIDPDILRPRVINPFPQGHPLPNPGAPIPPVWGFMEGKPPETGAKAGRRLRGEKVGLIEEIKDALGSLGEKLAEFLKWASYGDEEAPQETWLDWFKQDGSGFALKEVNGEPWLIAWSANAFLDRQEEIFSTKSLEEWAGRGARGHFNLWHIPGSDFARKDWVGVPGRILVEAGPFLDDEKGRAALSFFKQYPQGHPDLAPEGWGCSVEYRYLPEERKEKIYKNVEIVRTSVLPRFAAANVWTKAEVTMALTEEQKKSAVTVFGEALASQIIGGAEAKTKELEEAGVAHKEQTAGEADAQPEPEIGEKAKKPEEETEGEENPAPKKKSLDQFVKAIRDIAGSLAEDKEGRTALNEVADKLSAENMKDMAKELKACRKFVKEDDQRKRLDLLVGAMAGDGEYPKPEESPYPSPKELAEGVATEMAKQVQASLDPVNEAMAVLAKAMDDLTQRMDRMEREEAHKQATQVPRFELFLKQRATGAEETAVKEGDPLKEEKPRETQPGNDKSGASHFFGPVQSRR